MLFFNSSLSENPIIDEHIYMGITHVILQFMERMIDCTVRSYDSVLPDGKVKKKEEMTDGECKFIAAYGDFYPAWYPKERMFPLFSTLYALIKDKEDHVPDLEMEYLLASIIGVMAEQNTLALIWGFNLPSRDMDMLALKGESDGDFDDEETAYDIDAYLSASPEWFDICFFDADYELLDKSDTETLRNSDLNRLMGILDPEPSPYVVVGNWWDDDVKVSKDGETGI